mmetsp:Transcript_23145/g.57945  ORF Transcript_23145/g.57945 Transcript_23145/m.57945 type:complete len:221 (-) Transcript_23145:905-1567(-)
MKWRSISKRRARRTSFSSSRMASRAISGWVSCALPSRRPAIVLTLLPFPRTPRTTTATRTRLSRVCSTAGQHRRLSWISARRPQDSLRVCVELVHTQPRRHCNHVSNPPSPTVYTVLLLLVLLLLCLCLWRFLSPSPSPSLLLRPLPSPPAKCSSPPKWVFSARIPIRSPKLGRRLRRRRLLLRVLVLTLPLPQLYPPRRSQMRLRPPSTSRLIPRLHSL